MLKIKNNKIEVKKVKTLSKKHIRRIEYIKTHQPNKLDSYLKTLVGQKDRSLSSPKIETSGQDILSNKNEGNILKIKQKSMNTWSDHKPYHIEKTFGQWVGVEIECYIPDIGDDSSCDNCGGGGECTCYNCDGCGTINLEDDNGHTYRVNCRVCDGNGTEECNECDGSSSGDVLHSSVCEDLRHAIKKANIPFVTLKTDGSLSKDGVEITLLFNAARGFEPLEKLCKILNDFDASVNDSCGLHVHLDHRDIDSSQLGDIGRHWKSYLEMLAAMVPSTRRTSKYCQLRASTEKYSAVNLGTFDRYGTIEIRLHSGTTNFTKIKNWIEILRRIKAQSKTKIQKREVLRFASFCNNLKLPIDLINYAEMRMEKFNASKQTDEDFDNDSQQDEVA